MVPQMQQLLVLQSRRINSEKSRILKRDTVKITKHKESRRAVVTSRGEIESVV